MAKEYVVSNAMLAKDKDGNIKRFEGQHGTLLTWNVYFVGEDQKYQWQRKEGSEVKKGDVVYGNLEIVERGGYKFPVFKAEQRPLGQLPQASGADSDKIDYLIELVEAIAEKLGAKDVILDDIEDGPIDLSEVPF